MPVTLRRSPVQLLAVALALVIVAAASSVLTNGGHHQAAVAAPTTKPLPTLPTASYRAVAIRAGTATLSTAPTSFNGITLSASGSASRRGRSIVLPLIGGNLSLYPANATKILAQGTLYASRVRLLLQSGTHVLQLSNLIFDVRSGVITAAIQLNHKTLIRSAPVLLVAQAPAPRRSTRLAWNAGAVSWAPWLRQTVGNRLHASLPDNTWSSLVVSIDK